jgi:uncharacterized SAM-binding protein YcdF (DUF218 family)
MHRCGAGASAPAHDHGAPTLSYDSRVVESLAALVKTFIPGSLAFLLLIVGAGVALLFSPRTVAWGRRLLVLLLFAYLILASPLVATWLERGLHPSYPSINHARDALGARTVVVLGNGIVRYSDGDRAVHALTRRTAMNVLEGARLYQVLKPVRMIVSGGAPRGASPQGSEAFVMAEALATLGVPRGDIVLEPSSRNTREQSVLVAQLLKPRERIILVTTPLHMRRALADFAAQGCDAIPSPAQIEYTPETQSWRARLLPSMNTLRMSELVLYERLALARDSWIGEKVDK